MYRKKSLLAGVLFCVLFCLGVFKANAQSTPSYANNWIKYGKPYVRIGVAKKGIHRILISSLPKEFQVIAPEKLQLWRRGNQVSVLSASKTEILFYALPNDGARDSLLYRPMSSRLNPYFSLFSDEGAYFLVNADEAGKRSPVVNQPADSKVPAVPFHDEAVTTLYQNEYSLSTQLSPRPHFFNSYYELGASRTGTRVQPGKTFTANFSLTNQIGETGTAWMKMLLHGRSNNNRELEVYVGKNAQSLLKAGSVSISGFSGAEITFALNASDVDEAKKGIFTLKSTSTDRIEFFSIAYFTLGYQQTLNMNSAKSKEFNLPASASAWNRLQISGAAAGSRVLNITDENNPTIIEGDPANVMVPRGDGKRQKLLVTNEITDVAAAKMKVLNFTPYKAKEGNYIIIYSENLSEGAAAYAAYRASAEGGSYKPLLVKVTDLYNQFNYGEPSPLAVRNFMTYMLQEGGTARDLFIIGKSITHVERMKRELPDEVPTIGYPASDLLLVAGMAGASDDLPAIPVGRLSAINNQNVLDYLDKVKEYENNADADYGWRKNVVHLNGGKSVDEITQLRDLLVDLVPDVESGIMGGKVIPYVKQRAMSEVENVNITRDVNNGVGLITYFGHGSPVQTDLDVGYITDAARGYKNPGKYPMMYFNGCGVGNIFSARFNPSPANPNANDRITLSLDWLLAPKRGAIAVIANSFESFVSPASNYLQHLYHSMFADPATYHMPIGKIQLAVSNEIVAKDKDKYNVTNVQQSLLQGDPALKLVTLEKPDFAVSPTESITLYSDNPLKTIEESDSLRVGVIVYNYGRNVTGLTIPVEVTYASKIGTVTKQLQLKSFPLSDTLLVSFPNTRNVESIRISVDPKKSIAELSEQNNINETLINWESIKDEYLVSSSSRDRIAPLMQVKINSQTPRQDQKFTPNPEIQIFVQDDRRLLADTSLVDIDIKRCGTDTCDFIKVSYAKAGITLANTGEKSFEIKFQTTDFVPGTYELLVNARDSVGNVSPVAYRIRFLVEEQEASEPEVIVSPNPALSYARFHIRNVQQSQVKSIRYIIYNSAGTVVRDYESGWRGLSQDNDWYWTPNLERAGLYTYKVLIQGEGGHAVKTVTGKLVLIR